jgi:hypothetical protein
MEEITKEWPSEFLIPVDHAALSDLDLIRSPMVTREGMMCLAIAEGRKRNRYKS